MKLYSFWRSTTSYRVRIALNLKNVSYHTASVDLVADAQSTPEFTALNPAQGVPALVLEDGTVLTQSMAILDWLEETHPNPPILPSDPRQRALVRAAALGVACDIHPVNNLRVVAKLKSIGHDQNEAVVWMNDWMTRGLSTFSRLIRDDTPFCFGDTPCLADICLIPQLYNAHRWGCDITPFARLSEIETRCLALPSFESAHPNIQPDAC